MLLVRRRRARCSATEIGLGSLCSCMSSVSVAWENEDCNSDRPTRRDWSNSPDRSRWLSGTLPKLKWSCFEDELPTEVIPLRSAEGAPTIVSMDPYPFPLSAAKEFANALSALCEDEPETASGEA